MNQPEVVLNQFVEMIVIAVIMIVLNIL